MSYRPLTLPDAIFAKPAAVPAILEPSPLPKPGPPWREQMLAACNDAWPGCQIVENRQPPPVCQCGQLASYAIDGRGKFWLCLECFDEWRRTGVARRRVTHRARRYAPRGPLPPRYSCFTPGGQSDIAAHTPGDVNGLLTRAANAGVRLSVVAGRLAIDFQGIEPAQLIACIKSEEAAIVAAIGVSENLN
jgi:hypothetical protein